MRARRRARRPAPAAVAPDWRAAGGCLGALAALALGACAERAAPLPTLEVRPRDARFVVSAQGELVASEAVTIQLPSDVNMSFDIEWMVPEYSAVKRGEVIVRFDDAEVLSAREHSLLEMASRDHQLASHARDSAIARAFIDHEGMRVAQEQTIARTYADVDARLFSRNEILDALGDLEYLAVEDAYFGWQAHTHERRTGAERQRISARREHSAAKLAKQDSALATMALKSPDDGTFVYARLPWGEKLAPGHRVYPGRAVGLLPVRGKVLARLHVPEVDALGVGVDQSVQLRLDSDVGRAFGGRVLSVSAAAVPKARDDPRKYIVVDVAPDAVDAERMRVGSHLQAAIVTGVVEDAFLVPQQSVFREDGATFVFVQDGGDISRREVSIGQASASLIEITAGLTAGEAVCLAAPGT